MSFFAHGKNIKPVTNYLVHDEHGLCYMRGRGGKKTIHTKKKKEAEENKSLP